MEPTLAPTPDDQTDDPTASTEDAEGTFDPSSYWANAQGLDLAKEVFRRIEHYYRRLPETRLYKRWLAGWAAYNGLPSQDSPYDVTELGFTGDESELANLQVPHLAALGRHLVQMVTQDRIALDPIPVNTDYASESEAQVAKGVLNYLVKSEGLEKTWRRTVEIGVACGQAWQSAEWDATYGDWVKVPQANGAGSVLFVDPDTGTRVREGRLVTDAFMPWDVGTDLSRTDDKHIWLFTRKLFNKYDLAARWPGVADDILALEDVTRGWLTQSDNKGTRSKGDIESDLVPVFTFYHAKTPACPDGRWAVVLSDGLVLGQGGLPYDGLPLVQFTAGQMLGSQFGDSPFLHGIGIQKVIDKLASAVATNNINLARQCLAIPEGASYSPAELAEGMSVLYMPPGPDGQMQEPKAVQLVKSAPETYSLWEKLIQSLAIVTGVNGALSGADPAAQHELSGAAMVFLESQSLRFVSGAAASANDLIEGIGTRMIKILQRYAKSPKLARVAGKSRQFMMKEWNGSVFDGFDRVEIQRGNFAQNTPAFRMQLAENLRAGQLLDSKEQYFEVLAEGTADPLTESHTTRQLNIRKENELLAQGQAMRALLTDPHQMHIVEHTSVLDRPDLRDPSNPLAEAVAQATTEHIQEHIAFLQEPANAPLLMLLGQQPLPPPPPPPGMGPPMPPMPPGPPPPGPPQGPPPGPPVPQGPPPPGGSKPGQAGPPHMPQNPATGQRPPPPPGSSSADSPPGRPV